MASILPFSRAIPKESDVSTIENDDYPRIVTLTNREMLQDYQQVCRNTKPIVYVRTFPLLLDSVLKFQHELKEDSAWFVADIERIQEYLQRQPRDATARARLQNLQRGLEKTLSVRKETANLEKEIQERAISIITSEISLYLVPMTKAS